MAPLQQPEQALFIYPQVNRPGGFAYFGQSKVESEVQFLLDSRTSTPTSDGFDLPAMESDSSPSSETGDVATKETLEILQCVHKQLSSRLMDWEQSNAVKGSL